MEKKVLIVDDDREMCTVLGDILECHHYQVNVAYDGLQAIKKTHEQKFDLILLDVCMPIFSGFWFCSAFKNKPDTKNVPIVIMSGLPTEKNEEQAANLGAIAYLKKPFKIELLLKVLAKALNENAEN
ncbi:MAG: response regulator [Candidatus Omnitrophica bacterium]|nr:response regulator [Candidatus Omnitrophota bacterium]